jgi:polar amino acid transport system substrate-binding protein
VNARSRSWLRVLLPVLAAAALALGAVAATAAPGRPSSIRTPRAASSAGHSSAAACNPYASSLAPPPGPPQVTPGSFMATIRKRGYLIAGVDQNTYHFGFRDPFNGQLEGFDIDMIKAVAQAIFPDANSNPNRVHWKAISDAQREPDIWHGAVDIVAHTMTILCKRLKTEDFSSVYFTAVQKVLVLTTSKATSLADLRGQKVCATTLSDSLAAIVKYGAIPVAVPYWTDCLVLLQQDDVAAISTDDAILDGLKAQDPWTKILVPAISPQPYGLAISKEHPDFVRFVNAVLEQVRTDGQWAASYRHWLGTPVPAPPQPQYAN